MFTQVLQAGCIDNLDSRLRIVAMTPEAASLNSRMLDMTRRALKTNLSLSDSKGETPALFLVVV